MSGYLNHTPAQIARQILVDLLVASYPESDEDWPLYYSYHPDTPDNSLAIYDTEGRTQGRIQIDGEIVEQHGIQVRIRSDSVVDGYVKAKQIAMAFDREVLRTEVTLDESVYLVQAITRTTDVVRLGLEPETTRRLYTVNALVSLRLTGTLGTGSGS